MCDLIILMSFNISTASCWHCDDLTAAFEGCRKKKRTDDNQESIITRYEEYMKKTKPVLDFYSSRSYFHEIDGNQKIQVISGKIEDILRV